jgi:DmsE family decaheme c-type cytochrome
LKKILENKMNLWQKVVTICAFVGGVAVLPPASAADAVKPADPVPSATTPAAKAFEKDAVCTKCHDESETTPILSIYQTKHGVRGDPRTPNCQTCHGESTLHLKGNVDGKGRPAPDVVFRKGVYSATDEKERAGQCLSCHKDARRNNWDGGKHEANGMACNDCHKVHKPADDVLSKKTQTQVCFACHKEQRADSHKISTHPIDAGKVVCSDCHNPHGSTGPKLLKKNTVTETCYTCHAEKRGPFLFEHQPVTEDCANCHTPHGSNIAPLLKSRPPFLCQECHDGTHASGTPAGPNAAGFQGGLAPKTLANVNQFPSKNLVGRACMNCHSQVHGSNSPAGGYLQR